MDVNSNLPQQIEEEAKNMEGQLALHGEELKSKNSELLNKLEREK